jgi:DNA-binding IscR family transcriptional regulator
MYELAQLPSGLSMSVRDLCGVAEVPESFGEPLVGFLIEAGLVVASGYRSHLLMLARHPADITMAEVVRTCEPAFSLSPCAQDPSSCSRSPRCGVHLMWVRLDRMLWVELEQLTLQQIASGRLPEEVVSPMATVVAGLLGSA